MACLAFAGCPGPGDQTSLKATKPGPAKSPATTANHVPRQETSNFQKKDPIIGNAAEHFTAVSAAGKDKMDLSFAISMGSSTQIAVFVAPLMVVFAWLLKVPLTFEFGVLETVSAFLAVLIVNIIASDGKSNWLEGAMLLGAYAVLGAAFLFHP